MRLLLLMLVVFGSGCGVSIHGGRLIEPWNSDPEPPAETVPMTARFSSYRSMSVHLIAVEGVPRGTLGRLHERLLATARAVKPGPEILDQGATGDLDLRGTVQRLAPEGQEDGEHTPCTAVVLFELIDVEKGRVLASFSVTANRNDQFYEKPFEPVYRDLADQVGAWLIYRSKNAARPGAAR